MIGWLGGGAGWYRKLKADALSVPDKDSCGGAGWYRAQGLPKAGPNRRQMTPGAGWYRKLMADAMSASDKDSG
jgi:hypothetical protein